MEQTPHDSIFTLVGNELMDGEQAWRRHADPNADRSGIWPIISLINNITYTGGFFPLFAWLVECIFLCSLDLHTVLENFLLETKEKESTLSLNTALFQFVNSYGKEANFS